MESSQQNPPTLEYAIAPSKRRKWIFRAIALLLILAIIFCGWKWGPAAWSQAKVLYWQRQCMRYNPPADLVIYEEDQAAANRLLSQNSNYVPRAINSFPADMQTPSSVNAAVYEAPYWREFIAAANPISPGWSANFSLIMFMHEMKSPSGKQFLVCVRYLPAVNSIAPYFRNDENYEGFCFTPATWTSPPYETPRVSPLISLILTPVKHPLHMRMYAGQIDPNDPSHFTVRYEMWGQSDLADGYLVDRGFVTIKPRHFPTER